MQKEVFNARQGVKQKQGKKSVGGSINVYEQLKSQRRGGAFSSFSICPREWKFETQEPSEKIVLLLRQHPVVNVPWILLTGLLLVLPSFFSLLPFELLPVRFQVMTIVIWYLMVLAFVLERFLEWYFNVYIVTDERVVDIDFYGLIYRDITVTQISQIQDINLKQLGGVAAIFNYGDVFIQTAAENREFDFLRVPNPGKVVEILYMLMQEEEQEMLEGRVK